MTPIQKAASWGLTAVFSGIFLATAPALSVGLLLKYGAISAALGFLIPAVSKVMGDIFPDVPAGPRVYRPGYVPVPAYAYVPPAPPVIMPVPVYPQPSAALRPGRHVTTHVERRALAQPPFLPSARPSGSRPASGPRLVSSRIEPTAAAAAAAGPRLVSRHYE